MITPLDFTPIRYATDQLPARDRLSALACANRRSSRASEHRVKSGLRFFWLEIQRVADVAQEFLRKAKAAQARANQVRGITAEHPAMSEAKVRAELG